MSDNKPWLTNYPTGVPVNIDTSKYNSLEDFVQECFDKYTNRKAFTCMGASITYKQLDTYSKHFAAYLHYRGLNPGDKIAIMMPNLLQYPIAVFGALRAGLLIVNTNPLYTPREMLHQFNDSGADAVIIAENFAANLEEIIDQTGIKTVITTSIGELLGGFKGGLVDFVLKRVKRMVPKFELTNAVKFKQALKEGAKYKIKSFEVGHEDVAILQYTGGTTGVSKGAMLTHGNLIANMLQIKAWLGDYLHDRGEVTLSPLPAYHIFAFTASINFLMSIGAEIILIVNPRNLDSIIKEFKNRPISMMTGVNTLFNALLNNKKFRDLDFSNMKVTVAGGMALQTVVANGWKELTGCFLTEGYGLTETSPVASVNPLDCKDNKVGSIGMPVSSTELRIVDDSGIPLSVGEVGEIQIKGPQVMKGYYNRPNESAKVLNDGWFSTGDIGKMDSDGYFYIVDRKKDMINVSGFNVYPNEIEDVVTQHSKVLEAAAIGVPDEKSTEVVKLFVVKKDNSLTEEEIIAHCRANLTGYKIPRYVEFRKDLPKSNVGKILRRELRT